VGSSAVNGVTVWASPPFSFPPPAGGKLRRSKGGQKHSAVPQQKAQEITASLNLLRPERQ
jgi:hypothetical protein